MVITQPSHGNHPAVTPSAQMFECAMAITNLAVDEDLRDRIVSCGGWRTLLMGMSCENPQACERLPPSSPRATPPSDP